MSDKKFKFGDKVRYIGKDHSEMPEFYPEIGTIGMIVKKGGDTDWYIQWTKGSTSGKDCWYCDENDIELVKDEDMTNEEIWEMLEGKMRKNGLKPCGSRLLFTNGIANVYAWEDVHNAIALAYKVGYLRAMKGRPFKFGEKKKRGGHWEPVDPKNLPKEGTKVRYNGGLKGCNWKKNSEAKWIKTENDRFSIKFDEMSWTLDCMNRLLKYFDMWVEDDE